MADKLEQVAIRMVEQPPLYRQNTVNNKHNKPLHTKTNHKTIIHSPLAVNSIDNS